MTVSAFDHKRLKVTLKSTQSLPVGVEHIFIIPENDLDSRHLLEKSSAQGRQLKFSFDTNSGVYSAMNLGATMASGRYVIFWNSGDLMYSLSELEIFISELQNSKPTWAIAQGVLENGAAHENSLRETWNFRNQKVGSYVSHQAIACERKTMFDLGLFDTKYRVAADTKMIQALARLSSPMISLAKIVRIEEPKYSSKFHRRSRYETAKLASLDLMLRANCKPLINICKRELLFLKQFK